MILADENETRAIARLANNPDFKTFMAVLAREQNTNLERLLESVQPVVIHQLQGETKVLRDIEQTVRNAPTQVAGMNRG